MPYVLRYPGRFDEQPIPLTVSTSYGCSDSSAIACFSAASTPKSPHPGHQSGSTLPLRSLTVTLGRSATAFWPRLVASRSMIAITPSPSHLDLVHGHVEFGRARQDRPDTIHDVVRHERLAVVFSDVAVRREARLRPEIPRKLAAVVVLHDQDLRAPGEDRHDLLAVERHQPLDLQIVGRDPRVGELLHRFP